MVEFEVNSADVDWLEFKVDKQLSKKEAEYLSSSDALYSPIAKKIFGFPWAEAIRVSTHSVWVKKQAWVDWEILAEPLADLIQEHVDAQYKKNGALEENPEPPKSVSPTDPVYLKVSQVIETEVNPSVASHGGRVVLLEVKDSKAYVRLEGGCQGCAQSSATLKEGIEVAVKRAVPEILQVLDITDHDSGSNPYFMPS